MTVSATSPRARRVTAIGLLTAGLAALATGPVAGQERFELSSDHVAVYNLVGEVNVEPTSGSAVIVEVRRGGRDAGQLRIERGPLEGRETLRILYPGDAIRYRELSGGGHTTLRVRDDGTFGDHHGGRRDRWRDGRRVEIRGDGPGLEAYANLTIRVPAGQRIAVNLGVGAASLRNVHGQITVDAASAPVTATGSRGTLSIDVGSGTVSVTDAEGDVDLDTGSGSVNVNGVRGDILRVDTGSGSVIASRVAVATLDIDTGSGDIEVGASTADRIRLDTGSGSVVMDVASAPRSIEIDTGSGGVTLTIPASFGARVEIETGSGDIDVGFPVTVTRWERDHLVGTIGDGSGRLVIDTGSGSVRLKKRS